MQSENFDKSKTDINIKVTLLHYHYSEMSKQKNKLSVYDQINDVSVKGTGIKMIRVDTVIRKLTDCKFVYLDEGRKCDFSTFFTTYGDVVDVVVDSDCIGHTKYGDFNMKFDFDFTDLNTGLLCKIRDNKVVVIFDEFKYKYIYLSSSAYLENNESIHTYFKGNLGMVQFAITGDANNVGEISTIFETKGQFHCDLLFQDYITQIYWICRFDQKQVEKAKFEFCYNYEFNKDYIRFVETDLIVINPNVCYSKYTKFFLPFEYEFEDCKTKLTMKVLKDSIVVKFNPDSLKNVVFYYSFERDIEKIAKHLKEGQVVLNDAMFYYIKDSKVFSSYKLATGVMFHDDITGQGCRVTGPQSHSRIEHIILGGGPSRCIGHSMLSLSRGALPLEYVTVGNSNSDEDISIGGSLPAIVVGRTSNINSDKQGMISLDQLGNGINKSNNNVDNLSTCNDLLKKLEEQKKKLELLDEKIETYVNKFNNFDNKLKEDEENKTSNLDKQIQYAKKIDSLEDDIRILLNLTKITSVNPFAHIENLSEEKRQKFGLVKVGSPDSTIYYKK